jgi:sterol desaturase/sphingolipid hydroxylase (fatty acid hydroxylase superfamily)
MGTLQSFGLVGFIMDFLRTSLWFFILMAIFVPIEKLFALHRQPVFRKAFGVDTGYYFLTGLLPKLLLIGPMALLASSLHYVMPSGVQNFSAGLPLWARLAAALVVGEIGFYWGHRWTHEIPFLWRFHAIHHSAEKIDWLVSTRAHPLDIVFVRLCGFIPMYALGLAQPMAGRTIDVVPMLTMIIALVWGYFIHANVRWRFGWLSVLIATPLFHHWHHTNDEHIDKNYASMLPIMDLMFGTWYMPKAWPSKYGIDAPMPAGIPGQLVHPFLPREQEDDALSEVSVG